ncbi:hypothetical protein [Cellulosimicrobium marinum]|uniref:hypothetical protein n=1 Tax=Cellulosimicrobium marinum TaxID=1638992 RepID=UPI001E3EFD10|nr:hypothetical protein [Cellulosimicrobium marinum]MCB7135626.1 hypothetical protein [Cellulosimicrobium marinum]
MATVDYFLSGDHDAARHELAAALHDQGFAIATGADGRWTVSRGSKTRTFWLGAFAGKHQHMEFTVTFMQHGDSLVARVQRDTGHGAMAGAVGVSRSNTVFAEVDQAVGTRLTQAGILADVVHA